MESIPEGVDSRFRYVLLVSKRAEQLIQGSQPKLKSRHAKPTRVAMDVKLPIRLVKVCVEICTRLLRER